MGEELSGLSDLRAPGNAAAVLGLGLVGDLHPLPAGFFTPASDPALRCRGLAALGRRQLTNHGDLVAVDRDPQVSGEPAVRDAPREPAGCVRGIGQVALLPAAGATEGSTSS